MLFSPKYQQAKNGVVTTATNVEPWIKQYKKLEEFSPEACMSSSFKHRWSQLFHIFAPAIHANISTSVQLDFFVFKQPIRQIRINSILFDSRAKAPLAKRSERGYGDENEWAHRETLEGEFWRSLPLPHSLVLCIRARFFLWVYWNIDSVVNSGWLVDTYCAPYYYFCVEVVTSFFVPIGSSICKKNTFDLKSVTFHDVHLFFRWETSRYYLSFTHWYADVRVVMGSVVCTGATGAPSKSREMPTVSNRICHQVGCCTPSL